MNNFTKDHKWLLVSCLQKAIRKGFSDLAVEYADYLYDIDRSSLLYRLSVIAIEDIGLGNVDLIHEFMETQIKIANIEIAGGKSYTLKMVRAFSESVKDRSACDLCALSFMNEFESKTPQENEKMFLSETAPVVNRLIAGWEVLGASKLKNPLIINKEDNLERFMEINRELVVDEKVLSIMKNGYLIHREPHFIAIGLLASLLNKEKEQTVGNFKTGQYVEKIYPKNLINNTWLIDGIDWHTKEGKSAIYNFCEQKNDMTDWFLKQEIHHDLRAGLMGLLLFRTVGHQVNKRMVYPTAIVILKHIQKIEFEKLSNNKLDHAKTLKVFEKSLPELNSLLKQNLTTPDPKFFPF